MDDSINETALRSRRYRGLCSQLAVSLPEVVDQCSSFLSALAQPDGDDAVSHPSERLAALNRFAEGLDGHKQDVAELLSCGKYLVAVLDILECSDTPKAHEIRHRIDNIGKQLENIVNCIEFKRSELALEVEHFTETEAEIEKIADWLESLDEQEQSINQHVCLHEEDLRRRVELLKDRKADAEKWQNYVKQVVATCRQLRMAPLKYAGFSERCSSIVTLATQRSEHLDAVLRRLICMHQNAECIRSWISSMETSLTSNFTSIGSCVEQLTFVENMSNQWRLKKHELDDLLEAGRTVGEDEVVSLDRSALDQLLSDIEQRWCRLSKSLVNYVSTQV